MFGTGTGMQYNVAEELMRNTMELPPNPYTMERSGMNAHDAAVYNNMIIRTRVSEVPFVWRLYFDVRPCEPPCPAAEAYFATKFHILNMCCISVPFGPLTLWLGKISYLYVVTMFPPPLYPVCWLYVLGM